MHTPVLLKELIKFMDIDPDGTYVDCTGGGGGHAAAVLSLLGDKGRLIVLDRDPQAALRLSERFSQDGRVTVARSNFSEIDKVLDTLEIGETDGIYADFGVSSFQLEDGSRGFSFRSDGPIDMRMDNSSGLSALEVVNTFTPENMAVIIAKFGEERFARRIAAEIVRKRAFKKFASTKELADTVKSAVPAKFHKKGIHPATKTFQAFRIFVNGELESIQELMNKIASLIKKGGRFAAISFHSLEDRIVKDTLADYAKTCACPPEIPVCVCGRMPVFKLVVKKPVTPSESEIAENPLSRSAKMRVAEKL